MPDFDHTAGFDGITNFRDVATSINDLKHKQVLQPGKLYRSARPDTASASDKRRLTDQYGIRTIVDLRSKTEHIEAAKKRSNASSQSDSIEIPGTRYAPINLNGRGFERHLVWQLSYRNLFWLAGYMAFGYRVEGISIISKNVLLPRGLIGLGQDTLQHSGPEIKEVFDVLAEPSSYPVLVHCTQGKDRTGLIVLLVLMMCGIDAAAISEDYTMSEKQLEGEFEERMKEIRSIGLDESFARCPNTFVEEMNTFIDARYGSIERYLNSIRVTDEQIGRVRTIVKG